MGMKIIEHDIRKGQFSYFLGKIVTVQTTAAAVAYPCDERGTFLHFRTYGGICEGFDEYGVWLRDNDTKAKSFFFYKDIQGLIENPVLPADHPLVQQAKQMEKKNETCQAVLDKGREVMGSMGELTVEEFRKKVLSGLKPQ